MSISIIVFFTFKVVVCYFLYFPSLYSLYSCLLPLNTWALSIFIIASIISLSANLSSFSFVYAFNGWLFSWSWIIYSYLFTNLLNLFRRLSIIIFFFLFSFFYCFSLLLSSIGFCLWRQLSHIRSLVCVSFLTFFFSLICHIEA